MASHSRILAWEIPWTQEPGRLQSMGSQRVGHDWAGSCGHLTSLSMIISRSIRCCKWCYFILWLNNIPLYICTSSSLSIHLSMDIWAVSTSWLLWTVLLWILGCIYLFKLQFYQDICPWVGLLDHMATLFWVFWRTSMMFSIVYAQGSYLKAISCPLRVGTSIFIFLWGNGGF